MNAKWAYFFFYFLISRTNYIQRNDDDVQYVLDQHALLDLNTASSMKQQFTGRHVAPFQI
jgi:hypothetical protein